MKKVGSIFEDFRTGKIIIEYDSNAMEVGKGEWKNMLDKLWKGEYK